MNRFTLGIAAAFVAAALAIAQCPGGVCPPNAPSAPASGAHREAAAKASALVSVTAPDGRGFGGSAHAIAYDPERRHAVYLSCWHTFQHGAARVMLRMPGREWAAARIITLDQGNDLSVLLVGETEFVPTVRVSARPPNPRERVFKFGYPARTNRGQQAEMKAGVYLATGIVGHPNIGGFRCDMFRLDAYSGDSGCGIFLESSGDLVSVLWGSAGGETCGVSLSSIAALLSTPECKPLFPGRQPVNPPAPNGPNDLGRRVEDMNRGLDDVRKQLDELIRQQQAKPAPAAPVQPAPQPVKPSEPATPAAPQTYSLVVTGLAAAGGIGGLVSILGTAWGWYRRAKPAVQVVAPVIRDWIRETAPVIRERVEQKIVQVPGDDNEAKAWRAAIEECLRQYPNTMQVCDIIVKFKDQYLSGQPQGGK